MLGRFTRMCGRSLRPTGGVVAALGIVAVAAAGQLTERPLTRAVTHPAIVYSSQATSDRIADLSRRIDQGAVRLRFDASTGYLRSVLEVLDVPIESQMLVMSK